VDKDQKKSPLAPSSETSVQEAEANEFLRGLPEMRRPKPSPEAVAAAMEAAQRLAAEADAEEALDDMGHDLAPDASSGVACGVCGYTNRQGTKFCGMCGVSVADAQKPKPQQPSAAIALPQSPVVAPEMRPAATGPTGLETHHYHHHYHHHYFPGAQEGMYPRPVDIAREPVREDKMRPTAALRGEMSRAEAAVRRITHEFMLACNTKHLDDLLDLYVSDALVIRSNYPPIRGAAAVREFFFGALDAGLGEVGLDPLRVDVVGDLAYEAGRFNALIPGSTGKRREERGKYLWVFARQANGEWKLAADCWSSDLTMTNLESDVPANAGVKTAQARKNP